MNRVYLKKDIIRELAKRSGQAQWRCEQVLEAYHDLMVDVIYERDRLQDYGFIDLYTKFVPAHEASDPRDNTIKIKVPDKYKLVIKAGKSLKDILDIIEN